MARLQQSREATACLLAASPQGQMLLQQGFAGAPAGEQMPGTLMPGQTTPPPTQP